MSEYPIGFGRWGLSQESTILYVGRVLNFTPMLLFTGVLLSPGEPCAMMFHSRLWHMSEICELQTHLDLKGNSLGLPASYDQTFVYVSRVAGDAEGHFCVMQIGPNASLENAYVYVEATVNMSETPHAEEVYFSVFDSV